MKVKISVAISRDLVNAIDKKYAGHLSRSEFIEKAIREYITYILRDEQNLKDFQLINEKADILNEETGNVLRFYQALS